MARVAGAVLAAGAGSRMGLPKADLILAGVRLLDRAVGALRDAGCEPVLAVVRPGTTVDGARVVVNTDAARGLRSSLKLAVDAVDAEIGSDPRHDSTGGHVDALAVLPVDVPGVDAAAIAAVVGGWVFDRIAVASYAGIIGPPTVMHPTLWRAALHLAGPDEGARRLLRSRPELIDPVPVAGVGLDLDTPADVAAWLGRQSVH